MSARRAGPSRPFRVVAGLLLLGLAVELGRDLERRARATPPRHSLYLPSGRHLRPAALGFHLVLADLLYVWSIQYYSVERADRWHHLGRLFDVITDLDPRFVAAYSTGALVLALEAGDRHAALALLEKGMKALPGTYVLPWEAGFYARELGDPRRAAEYFRVAGERPDAPGFVTRWYGYMLDRIDDDERALAYFQDAYARARSDADRAVIARYIHDLTLDLHLRLLRETIAGFRAREGRLPFALEELVRAGDLGALPIDPDGRPYLYDRSTGEVRSASSFLLRHRLRR